MGSVSNERRQTQSQGGGLMPELSPGAPAQRSPALGLIVYCCYLEIGNSLLTRDLHFHFALGPAKHVAGPGWPLIRALNPK